MVDLRGYNFTREEPPVRIIVLLTGVTAAAALVAFWGTFDLAKGIYAIVYLAVTVAWYVFFQVRLLCTNCVYYNERCPRGLGKVAPHLFRRDSGAAVIGGKLAMVFWPYWFIGVPVVGFALALVSHFRWTTFVYGVVFGVAAGATAYVQRRFCLTDCACNVYFVRSPALQPKPPGGEE